MHKPLNRRVGLTPPCLVLSTSIVLLLAACGGGGGGGGGPPPPPQPSVTGNGAAPTTGPGDTSSYFPIGAQDSWVFDFTTNDPKASATSGTETATITGTMTIGSANATVFTIDNTTRTAGPYDTYFGVSNGGVTAFGNSDLTDTISPLIVPYVQLLFPVALGQVSLVTGTNLPFGKDSNGNPITLNLTQTISNAAMETVDVPAGTFVNALKQTTAVAATAFDGMQSAQITGSDTTWYAAGVGEIKDQAGATAGGTSIVTEGDLRRYLLNGQWHGIGPSTAVDSTLKSSACRPSTFDSASVASDGTNFLVVAVACSASGATTMSNWVGVLVGPNGTTLSTVNITPPGAGAAAYGQSVSAFDGTHYLVVYEGASASTSSAPLESVVIGTDGSIVAGPTMVGTQLLTPTNLPTNNETLGFDGSRFLLIYTDAAAPAGTVSQVSGLFLTPGTGQASGAVFTISQDVTSAHGSPAIAFDGTNYLVAWVFSGTSPVGLHAMRVSSAGALLDAAPLVLVDLSAATLVDGCCDLAESLAFDGTNYLVAYRDPRSVSCVSGLYCASISAARLSTAGVLLDGTTTSPGIVIAGSKSTPRGRVRSVFMGGVYWVVWESSNPAEQLSATRVTPAGVVAAAWTDGFTLVPQLPGGYTQAPMLAASSTGSLLTWLVIDSTSQEQLMGLRIYP